MIQKDGSILINEFKKGSSIDGSTGFLEMSNAYVDDGAFGLNVGLTETQKAVGNVGGLNVLVDMMDVYTSSNSYYGKLQISYAGEVAIVKSNLTNQSLATGLINCYDIARLDSHIYLVSYRGGIGAVILDGTTAYWQAGLVTSIANSENYYIKLLASKDGKVYFANKNKVGAILTWTQTSASTISITSSMNVLDLPKDNIVTALEDYDRYLIIGTGFGEFDITQNYTVRKESYLYKWDKNSASFYIPIKINESSIKSMTASGNLLYFCAGESGNVYVTDGTSVNLLKQIPLYTKVFVGDLQKTKKYNVLPNAMAIDIEGNLLIGVCGRYSNVETNNLDGVYRIKIKESGYPIERSYTHSLMNNGINIIGFVDCDYTGSVYCSVYNSFDLTNYLFSTLYNYVAKYQFTTFTTDFMQVSGVANKKVFKRLLINFDRGFSSPYRIDISYRERVDYGFRLYTSITSSPGDVVLYPDGGTATPSFGCQNLSELHVPFPTIPLDTIQIKVTYSLIGNSIPLPAQVGSPRITNIHIT